MAEHFIEPARPGETRDEYLARVLEDAPPLRDEDRTRLADLLRPARKAAPAASTNTPDTHKEAS
jgi:hypothetical protein